ncbi:MAG: hypothetical protein ACJA1C_000928 [Crocinitomicaceae bacterium]|jgi:hypothetical protein
MSLPKYYPRLSDLVDAQALPGDFEAVENFLNEGIDLILGKIYYKDYSVQIIGEGETKLYSITLLSKAIKLPLFEGANLVFFYGSESVASEFPLVFRWTWPVSKYISNFDVSGFSYAPEAFIDILIELSEIRDRKDLFRQIIQVFLEGGDDAYLNLHTDLTSIVSTYNNGNPSVITEINAINTSLGLIKDDVQDRLNSSEFQTTSSIFDAFESNSIISTEVANIQTAIETLEEDLNISIDLFQEVIRALVGGLSDLDEKFRRLIDLFKSWLEDIDKEDLHRFLIPQFGLELKSINMALEFPRKWLSPVIPDPDNIGGFIPDPVLTNLSALVYTAGSVKYSTEKGFEFELAPGFNFEKAIIGKTGIMLEFLDVKLDMSDTYNIPEATADGRPDDFQGVFVGSASVTLPAKWFKNSNNVDAVIFGEKLLIGTGGFSGTIGLKAMGGTNMFWCEIGEDSGFELGFSSFDIEFKQNKVVESNIKAAMKIEKFVYPASSPSAGQIVEIGIDGHINDEGDFNLTASAVPPFPIELEEVFIYDISSIELGSEDGEFYIGTSGSIQFQGFLKDTLKLGPIDIDKMRIYSDGSIEFQGGSINLLEPIVLALGPVEITVSAIHFGSIQREINGEMRKFNYFGFDGGISVDPLGIEIRGDGVKFYYCSDDLANKPDSYLHIQTLYLDLTIPSSTPAVIFNGWLSIPEPGASKEYAGGIKLQIPKAKISGSAAMKLMPKYPAFIIDVEVDLPAPITIGPVGIYGFRGLIGYRYVAEKEAIGLVSGVDSWYDYYKAPPRGIAVQKFNGPDRTTLAGTPFSLGFGASLGTSFDNGTIVNIRAMILLSIPSLFMIDGKAALLSARLGLEDTGEPPFFAFIALGDNSLEFGIGADFKMPTKTGKTLTLYADIQAGFFFNDSSKWYVNVGTKTNPITARIVELVTIKSFLMMSATGIEAGARGEFDFLREYGPGKIIKVAAWAYIEVGGKISFEKPQFGAYMAAGVGADIDIKIVSLFVSFDVLLGVEAPKPFLLYGEFKLCVAISIAWVFKFKFCGELSLEWEYDSNVDRTAVSPILNIDNLNQGKAASVVKGVNMLSNETFDLAYVNGGIPAAPTAAMFNTIIPLDTYVDIKTEKGFIPSAISDKIGGYNNPPERYTELVPPQKIVNGKEVRQVKHQYSIESISLKSWNPDDSLWNDYHPYVALYPTDPALADLKIGQFQKSGNQYNTVRLLATTPFSYTEQGEPGWFIPEQNGITAASLFCETDALVPECANFLEKPFGTEYYCYNSNQLFFSNEAAFLLLNRSGDDHATVSSVVNPFSFTQSLSFENHNILQVRLPEPSVQANLKLTSNAQNVKIKYYASLIDDTTLQVQYGHPDITAPDPLAPYEVIVSQATLASEVVYNHPEWLAVTRIEIEPISGDQQAMDDLLEQIAEMENNNDQITLGLVQGKIQDTRILEDQYNALLVLGCYIVHGEGIIQCATQLHEVCWLSLENYEFNLLIPSQAEIEADAQATIDGITQYIQPIWRPDTTYVVSFTLKDVVDNGLGLGTYAYTYGFSTAGPLGFFHKHEKATYGDIALSGGDVLEDANGIVRDSGGVIISQDPMSAHPEKYPLTSLTRYIDYDRSYPNADGNLLKSKPLFYDDETTQIDLFYSKAYATHFFHNWQEYNGEDAVNGRIKVVIKDPREAPATTNPPYLDFDELDLSVKHIPQTVEMWQDDPNPLVPFIFDQYANLIAANLCTPLGGIPIVPPSQSLEVKLKHLKPLKLYTAIVNNLYDLDNSGTFDPVTDTTEVHKFTFQTSRYKSFLEQVNSYKLEDPVDASINAEAVFNVDKNLSALDIAAAWDTMNDIANPLGDDLDVNYQHKFDRIIEGLWGFAPMNEAVTTEFNVIRNTNDADKIVALVIRNPEPFNNPKIPLNIIEDTIAVLTSGGVTDTDYKVLHSKDYSQVIVMKNTLEITSDLDLKFMYKVWDGNAYIVPGLPDYTSDDVGTVVIDDLNITNI